MTCSCRPKSSRHWKPGIYCLIHERRPLTPADRPRKSLFLLHPGCYPGARQLSDCPAATGSLVSMTSRSAPCHLILLPLWLYIHTENNTNRSGLVIMMHHHHRHHRDHDLWLIISRMTIIIAILITASVHNPIDIDYDDVMYNNNLCNYVDNDDDGDDDDYVGLNALLDSLDEVCWRPLRWRSCQIHGRSHYSPGL